MSDRAINPTHARIVYLLAVHGPLTDAQLVRRHQSRELRAERPWPYAADSTLRTRREELLSHLVVREAPEAGVSLSKRRTRRWELADPQPLAIPPGASPRLRPALDELLEQSDGDLTVRVALVDLAHAAGVAL